MRMTAKALVLLWCRASPSCALNMSEAVGVVNLQNLQKFNWKLGSNIQSVSRGFESMARRIGPGIQDLARGVGPGIKDLSRNLGALGSNVGTNINDFSRVSLSNLEGYSKDIRNHVQDFFDMTMKMSPRISNTALDECSIYVIESLRHSAKQLTRAHADDVQAREDKHKVALATVRKGHEERLRLLSAERARHGEELRVFRDQQASHVKALNENHRQEVQGLQRKVASQLKAHRVLPAAHQTTRRNSNSCAACAFSQTLACQSASRRKWQHCNRSSQTCARSIRAWSKCTRRTSTPSRGSLPRCDEPLPWKSRR